MKNTKSLSDYLPGGVCRGAQKWLDNSGYTDPNEALDRTSAKGV